MRNARLGETLDSTVAIREFERVARMSPEQAAVRIAAAIERKAFRVRLGTETYVADWLKRLFPAGSQRALASIGRRAEARLERAARSRP